MPLRIGFDMDGVLADFESAFHDVEVRLFGPDASSRPDDPEQEEEAESRQTAGAGEVRLKANSTTEVRLKPDTTAEVRLKPDTTTNAATEPREMRRRHDAIWNAIRATPNFWTTLKPLDAGAVRRLHELMMRYRWEVFFVTQRPETEGDTVQRQTQRWLVEQGFDLPSVLVLGGSRGAAAAALRLDYHVDDHPQHCIDVVSESHARPILIFPGQDQPTAAKARKLGIATAPSIGECLDVLEEATLSRAQPGLLARIATRPWNAFFRSKGF